MIEKILLYIGKNPSKAKGEKVMFVSNTVESLGGQWNPDKFCSFHSRLRLEAAFPALKVTRSCYINMNISLP